MVRPTDARSAALLQLMLAPGHRPSGELVKWMSLVAGACRSSLAPTPLPPAVIARWYGHPVVVAAGAHDVFPPPHQLDRVTARQLGVEVRSLPDAGHLSPDEQPAQIVALVDEVCHQLMR